MKSWVYAMVLGLLLVGCGQDALETLRRDEPQDDGNLESRLAAETRKRQELEKQLSDLKNHHARGPKSTPVEQKDARQGSMVDEIVGRSDTSMRNTDDSTAIDIDVLHRIAQDWYKRLRLNETGDETIRIEATPEGIKVTLFHGDEKPLFEKATTKLTDYGKKVMQKMSWLMSQHVLTFRVDSHSNHLAEGRGGPEVSAWDMSLAQGTEVTDALFHYSGGELSGKLERVTGHGSTKPNGIYPNRPEKNGRVELSLVLDVSKEDLEQYK